jgi:hypothetical protein
MSRTINIKDYTAEELEKMEIPELEAHMTAIHAARGALRQEQLEVGKILEDKERRIKVAQKMKWSQMNEEERKIAVQIVKGSEASSTEKSHTGTAR